MDKTIKKLAEASSRAALFEGMAEESTELAHASLKMSRRIRGENPTPRIEPDIMADIIEEMADIIEEMADVMLMMEVVSERFAISPESIESIMIKKADRWCERLDIK